MDTISKAIDDILVGRSSGMQHIMDLIIKDTGSEYGLIAEKMKDGFIRFHSVYGIADDSMYMRGFKDLGYVDFSQPGTLHNRILTSSDHFICDDILTHRKGCPLSAGHPAIKAYCSFAITKAGVAVGVVSLGRTESYDRDVILPYLSQYNDTIANLLLLHRKLQDLKKEAITFIANTGGELRVPLEGIVSVTRMLDQSQLHSNQRESINIISRCSLHLLDIVNDIIDYSRMLSGQLKLNLQPCSIKQCVDNVYQVMKDRAHDKNLALTLNVDPSIPVLILGDNTRITQILVNVVENAIKFTKKGQINVSAKKQQDSIRFTITDTGTGMTDAQLELLMKPCCKLGLGLSITCSLVELHRGTIKIDSQVGKGTVVDIHIPIQRYDDIVDMEHLKDFYEKYPILIVDSNVVDRTVIFDVTGKVSTAPIMTNNIADAMTYLSRNSMFGYKMVIVNANNFDIDEFNGIDIPDDIVVLLISDNELLEKITIRYTHHILYPFSSADIMMALNANYILHQMPTIPVASSAKILIASSIDEKQAVNMLKSLGYPDIDFAHDGLDMFVKITTGYYDICFVDLKLAVIDGITAARKIRETTKNIALVALAPSMSEATRDDCFKAGMNGYILKPVNKAELEKIMNTVVMKKISQKI